MTGNRERGRTRTSMLCPKATSKRHSEFAGRSWVETVDERVGAEMEV